MTKPIPLSGGIAFRNAVATSNPPADMPIPAIGNGSLGFAIFCAVRGSGLDLPESAPPLAAFGREPDAFFLPGWSARSVSVYLRKTVKSLQAD